MIFQYDSVTEYGGKNVKRVSQTTNYTLTAFDYHVGFDTSAAVANVIATLPASSAVGSGFTVIIKDEGGQASTTSKNIVITPNGTDSIESASNLTINTNYGTYILVTDGAGHWFKLSSSATPLTIASASAPSLSITNSQIAISQNISTGSSVTFLGATLSGLSSLGVVHTSVSGVLSTSTIVDADVSATAAIAGTKVSPVFGTQSISTSGSLTVSSLSTAGVTHNNAAGLISTSLIIDADVSATAAIQGTKVSPAFGTQSISTSGTLTLSALSTAGVLHNSALGVVSSSTIVDSDVSGLAAIAGTKVSPSFGSQAIVTSGSLTISSLSAAGVVHNSALGLFSTSLIVDADISAAAGIQGSKVSPNFGSQAISTSGSLTLSAFTSAGILHNNTSGAVSSSLIVDADVSATAAILRSKLAAGTASQIVVNDISGALSSIATVSTALGGTGLTSIGTANQLLGANAGATALEYKTLLGTTNQVIVALGVANQITLSLPQSISSSSSPSFAGLSVGSLTGVLFATSGVVSTAIVPSASGGTGVSNGGTLTYGANSISLTTSGVTSLTLPVTGTLSTLSGVETLTNKTISGAIYAGGTIDNAVIGGTTPAAASFTSLSASLPVTLSTQATAPAAPATGTKVYSDATSRISFMEFNGITAFSATLDFLSISASRVYTFPDVAGTVALLSATQTFTNKSIDAATNTITNLTNSSISASASIARSKIAVGTINQVVINDGSGNLSSEAALSPVRGGTGLSSLAVGDLIYGSAVNTYSRLSAGSNGTFLQVVSGLPAWTSLSSVNITAALGYTPVNKAGDTMSGGLNTPSIDGVSAGSTLNLGTSNATTINIGGSGVTVNIQGTTTHITSINTDVTDKIFTLNKNGTIGSATGAGFQIEEGGTDTGYLLTDGTTRTTWLLKAPAATGIITFAPGSTAITINQDLQQSASPTFAGATISSLTTAGLVHNSASGVLSSSLIVNADVSATAAISGTKISPAFGTQNISSSGTLTLSGLSTAGVVHNSVAGLLTSSLIVDADVSALAAISGLKVTPAFGAQNISSSGTFTLSALSTAGVVHNSAAGLIISSLIVDADIATGAAIAGTKISPVFGTQNISTSGTLTLSGLSTVGVVHNSALGLISTSLIVDADVSATAAISGTKVSPAFGAQNISTSGTLALSALTTAGLLHNNATGVVSSSLLVDADVSITAAIQGTKVSPAFGTQSISASGTLTISSLATTGVVHNSAAGLFSTSLIVDADVSATAAISGTKVSPAFGAQSISTTGTATFGATTVTTLSVTSGLTVNSLLTLQKGFVLTRVAKTANYTMASSDIYVGVDSSAAVSNIVISLPSAATTASGQFFIIKDEAGAASTSSQAIVVTPNGTDTIDGAASFLINFDYGSVTLVCNGTNKWSIV